MLYKRGPKDLKFADFWRDWSSSLKHHRVNMNRGPKSHTVQIFKIIIVGICFSSWVYIYYWETLES